MFTEDRRGLGLRAWFVLACVAAGVMLLGGVFYFHFVRSSSDAGVAAVDFGVSEAPFRPAYEMPLQDRADKDLAATASETFGIPRFDIPSVNVDNVFSRATREFDVLHGVKTSECTGAFALTDGARVYAVTAGHCGQPIPGGNPHPPVEDYGQFHRVVVDDDRDIDYALFEDGVIDNRVGTSFSGGGKLMQIKGVVAPKVGMNVCSYGRKSGWRCGTVTEVLGDTAFRTNFVSRIGDSGGVVIAGDKLVGVVGSVSRDEQGRVKYTTSTRADYIVRDTGMALR